ncbi:MBL fold metallo-hydrolase [Candidatus Aminicenantes bacterium AC-334-K16]|jgi:metallo-beta-lactamase family protein|nr:MBL fold metallo-hydrolase [Candidatus Aminicenantes bacterium AC-334-K16]
MVTLKFLGATKQVTGSSFLLSYQGKKILVDCGLYQEREYLSRNWEDFPIPPEEVDYLLLTHIHLDHCGLLPKFVRDGFRGKILTTSASQELLPIMLLDSARIQEEDAAYKKKRHLKEGRRGPYPEIPLYTVSDAELVFPLVQKIPYEQEIELFNGLSVRFHDAGHIIGAAMIEVKLNLDGVTRKIIFSGDIGQWHKPIVRDPSVFFQADYIVMESTYGDRNHEDEGSIPELLAQVVQETVSKGGKLVIPTFAVERAQELLFHFSRLVRGGKIPTLPLFLDSPMAVDVTEVFLRNTAIMDRETRQLFAENESPFRFPGLRFVRTVDESKAINEVKGPCIIMAGSGMCTGGRIKHHLVHNISRPESTILFVGYQARGTLGRLIVEGREEVRIHGVYRPVRAQIRQIHGFSAHADRTALLKWLDFLRQPPRKVFLVHGEEEAIKSLGQEIDNKGWSLAIPSYQEEFHLD